jgi:hypothetical protein
VRREYSQRLANCKARTLVTAFMLLVSAFLFSAAGWAGNGTAERRRARPLSGSNAAASSDFQSNRLRTSVASAPHAGQPGTQGMDLKGFSFDRADIEALKSCKSGDCLIQI